MNALIGRSITDEPDHYEMRISRLTVDKLGVKLYDRASAVVAELVANGYDADAETVTVRLPLSTALASKNSDGSITEHGYVIEVIDDGHGMTPKEAQEYFLNVGGDRRNNKQQGAKSRGKKRAVMGRKGIGKLAPFGICKRMEVISAGGQLTPNGYRTSHFLLDYDKILSDDDKPVPLESGDKDKTYSKTTGTTIRLTNFQSKRVPDADTFYRQLASRFVFAAPDFKILVEDTRDPVTNPPRAIEQLDVPTVDDTRIDLSKHPIYTDDGEHLPVSGWLALAKDSYKYEEMAGVRIYARNKIVATTRDFEQPAGFTGEFTIRSYLVGEVHAEWLDRDDGEDLVRSDRQGILWESEYGRALKEWGAGLIREIGKKSKAPRRAKKSATFMERSDFVSKANERFGDPEVVSAAVEFAKQIGAFAAEDELADNEYVEALADIILSVAPHKALMEALQEFSRSAAGQDVSIEKLLDLFGKTRVAELASYAQIAQERVDAIQGLEKIVLSKVSEDQFQKLLEKAPWLIDATWTVISKNEPLNTFKSSFEYFYQQRTNTQIILSIGYSKKRPDFICANIGHRLHIVEIKKANYEFSDSDFERLANYVDAFREFFAKNPGLLAEFSMGWQIDLIADGVSLKNFANRVAFDAFENAGEVKRTSWVDFLNRAKKANEQFLNAYDKAVAKRQDYDLNLGEGADVDEKQMVQV